MRVVILGSGTAVPSLERNSTGILVQQDGINHLFDFGYGTLKALLKLGITYHDLDRVFFTHHHPDHMCDLIPFLFGSRYYLDPRRKPLEIVAAPGFKSFFDQVTGAFGHWLQPTEYAIRFIEQDEETREYDGLLVTSGKVKHIDLSRGYRVTDPGGRVAAISGDTDYCAGMIELGRGADLMILECAWPDAEKTDGHLSPTWAAKLAREAACKTLCLTHFYPPCDLDEIRTTVSRDFPGKLVLASDEMAFDL